jgi:hypothetical protein
MARIESKAIGGYYKTPESQLPRIAGLLRAGGATGDDEADLHDAYAVADPCAGDGEAVGFMAHAIVGGGRRTGNVTLYTAEMEATRHAALKERFKGNWNWQKHALGGDAFRVSFSGRGVGLLYLNPPYDHDPEHGRLEERFLRRFYRALVSGGVLAFVVPHYALAASASTLATHFRDLRCFRFAGDEFDVFKQVVVFGVRGAAVADADDETDDGDDPMVFGPDARLVELVNGWASSVDGMPELPESGPALYAVPPVERHTEAFAEWTMKGIDLSGLAGKVLVWQASPRGGGLAPVESVLPALPVDHLLARTYDVATPPRPAHLASGIAAGIFNGARIDPDTRDDLPALLIKGAFDREWRTVEEKENKKGEKVAEVQVQQPKLVVSVLDLRARRYHTIKPGAERTAARSVDGMTVADLLHHYGQSLMGVMERQCQIGYDPRRDAETIPLAPTARRLFDAQSHATRACVRLLGGAKARRSQRRGRAAILLGEIGSGKSTVALTAAATIGARRVLILCPPHLLDSWRNEIAAVLPGAEARVLTTVSDVDALAAPTDHPIIAILSREAAKLGHGWAGVGAFVGHMGAICPRCGAEVPDGDLARKRSRCEAKSLRAGDDLARACVRLALQLRAADPEDLAVRGILRSQLDAVRAASLGKGKPGAFTGIDEVLATNLLAHLATRYVDMRSDGVKQAIVWALAAAPAPERIARMVRLVAGGEGGYSYQSFARELLHLLPPGGDLQATLAAEIKASEKSYYGAYDPWQSWRETVEKFARGEGEAHVAGLTVKWSGGALRIGEHAAGTLRAACEALRAIATSAATWTWSDVCREPLFAAVPAPRRVPLASYIAKYHRRLFDLLIVDESHEYNGDGSAQSNAAHRLTALGMPSIRQTGSVMNGYAESVFGEMWVTSPRFRDEFERSDRGAFVDRYGYRKQVVQEKDGRGEVVAFGSHTDRVQRTSRDAGSAPGILPLFLFRHLLPVSVTLHKADLAIDLPPCSIRPVPIEPSKEQFGEYRRVLQSLKTRIAKDRFEPGRANKLFGALAQVPSFLDRATSDVGNVEGGGFEVRYPESIGGDLVVGAVPLDPSTVLPKEAWLIETVRAELAEGRNVIVLGWHLDVLPRLQRLLEAALDEVCPILWASKVPTAKRQAWIDREIVQKNRRG